MDDLSAQRPQVRPVGLLTRYLAWFFDCVFLWLAMIPIVWVLILPLEGLIVGADGIAEEVAALGMILVSSIVRILIQLPVYSYYYYTNGQTPGKRLFGIRIVDFTTLEPLTAAQAVGRYLGSILSSCCCWSGYLLAVFNGDRRALHDFIAGTRVAYSQRVAWTTGEAVLTAGLCFFAVIGVFFVPILVIGMIEEAMRTMENPLWYLNP